jgi:hypothetical protein
MAGQQSEAREDDKDLEEMIRQTNVSFGEHQDPIAGPTLLMWIPLREYRASDGRRMPSVMPVERRGVRVRLSWLRNIRLATQPAAQPSSQPASLPG